MSSTETKLSEVFAVLTPGLRVDTVPVSPTLYPDLDSNYDGFKGHVLIAEHRFTEAWPTWEMHPAGDEVVVLMSGRVEMVLRRDGADESVWLTQPGAFVVVPRGTWHTARPSEETRMLFITPGEGTENRAEV